MGVIKQLDKSVYNRLAAGEVVENPASIVKELAENCVDAGATEISVGIEKGGIKSICVSDDGCGMTAEDLKMSIVPHATSKISDFSDMDTLDTLGFRGEALASIASVAKIELRSRFVGSDSAWRIVARGGEIVESGECRLAKGTSATVEALFFNTPARFKFLRPARAEEASVTRVMHELSLANPRIAFDYSVDGERRFRTSGSGIDEALVAAFGAEVYSDLIPFRAEEGRYKAFGHIGRPASSAIFGNRAKQTFIVNGRVFDDANLHSVIKNAYGERLMRRTFPAAVVEIVAPFDELDVNAHPQKREVRFARKRRVEGLAYRAMRQALDADAELNSDRMRDAFFAFDESAETGSEPGPDRARETPRARIGAFPRGSEARAQSDWSLGNFERRSASEKPDDAAPTGCRALGQAFDTYLIAECGDRIYFIDQHAVHERILYDRLMRRGAADVAQGMLVPYERRLDGADAEAAERCLGALRKLGFDIALNDSVLSIGAVPAILCDMDLDRFVDSLFDETRDWRTARDIDEIRDRLATKACKSAIKGGTPLTESESEAVLDYFIRNDLPAQCPHGRPTYVEFTKYALEKMFRRVA